MTSIRRSLRRAQPAAPKAVRRDPAAPIAVDAAPGRVFERASGPVGAGAYADHAIDPALDDATYTGGRAWR